MTRKQAAIKFFEHLKDTNPLPNIAIELALINRIRVSTDICEEASALCTLNTMKKTALLEVATRGKEIADVLDSIGHEYFHVMQWFNDGDHASRDDGMDEYLVYECAAMRFGREESYNFMVAEGLA